MVMVDDVNVEEDEVQRLKVKIEWSFTLDVAYNGRQHNEAWYRNFHFHWTLPTDMVIILHAFCHYKTKLQTF